MRSSGDASAGPPASARQDATGLYNRGAAHSYADTWSRNDPDYVRNAAYPSFTNDCTNFSSQMLQAGGYPKHDGFYADCNNAWWLDRDVFGNWIWAHAWAVADCQGQFFASHPGDFTLGSCPGCLTEGDVLLMDLDGVGHPTHARLVVGWGQDEVVGVWDTLIDQHTSERRHRYWSFNIGPYTPVWSWSVTW